MRTSTNTILAMALFVSAPIGGAHGGVTAQITHDLSEWENWVSEGHDRITFTELGNEPVFVTDQYAHLGVHFPQPDDTTEHAPGSYDYDGWGLDANGDTWITFDGLRRSFAHSTLTDSFLTFYREGVVIYESPWFGGQGGPYFNGLILNQAFDAVFIAPEPGSPLPGSQVALDDIFVGHVVPAPGAGVLAGLGLLGGRRRRRRRERGVRR